MELSNQDMDDIVELKEENRCLRTEVDILKKMIDHIVSKGKSKRCKLVKDIGEQLNLPLPGI